MDSLKKKRTRNGSFLVDDGFEVMIATYKNKIKTFQIRYLHEMCFKV